MKRFNLSIALSMLAVFLSGAVVGGFAHRLYTVRSVDAAPQRRTSNDFRQRYLNEMKARLNLDDAQTARMSEVLDHTRARFRDFNDRHKSEMDAIHSEQITEIRAMLRPEQQESYQQYLVERDKRRKEHEKGK